MSKTALRLMCLFLFLLLFQIPTTSGLAQTPTSPKKPFSDGSLKPPQILNTTVQQFSTTLTPDRMTTLDWNRLVFEVYQGNGYDLYMADTYGNNRIELTSSPASDLCPRSNHAASKIAFHSDRNGQLNIFVMNNDGSGIQPLTTNSRRNYTPDWSPDDRKIVFISNRTGSNDSAPGDVYVMNADGTGQTALTHNGNRNGYPVWSPDGSKIAWVVLNDIYGSLWIMNADGSSQRAITPYLLYLGHPAWAPDGSRIAYDFDVDGDDWNEVVSMNIDGAELTVLYDPERINQDAWMGDWIYSQGSRIAFTLVNYMEYNNQLYIGSSYIGTKDLVNNNFRTLGGDGNDMFPAIQSLDPFPPNTHIKPLSEYTRAFGFPISIEGGDIGASGINVYEVQYQMDSLGFWSNLLTDPTDQVGYLFNYGFYDTVRFRSRGTDHAGNQEPWPGENGDTWTKLYNSRLETIIQDNRGMPLPNTTLTISPSPWETSRITKANGKLSLHFKDPGNYTFGASHPGYSPNQTINQHMALDTSKNFSLLPKDNHLQDGDFETGLIAWQLTGPVTLTTKTSYSGEHSAQLGPDCGGPCFSDPETPQGGNYDSSSAIAADSKGNMHVAWDYVKYSVRDQKGNWSSTANLSEYIPNYGGSNNLPRIVVDAQDTVHVIADSSKNLYHLGKLAGGVWKAEFIGVGNNPIITIAKDNSLHLGYSSGGTVYYRRRLATGNWDPAITIGYTSLYYSVPMDIVVDTDGTAHIIYSDDFSINHFTVTKNGVLSARENYYGQYSDVNRIMELSAVIDSQDHIYVLYTHVSQSGYSTRLVTRYHDGSWSGAEQFQHYLVRSGIAVGPDDRIHIVASLDGTGNIAYFSQTQINSDFQIYSISFQLGYAGTHTGIAVDHFGKVYLIIDEANTLVYMNTDLATEDLQSSISQAVTISQDMHQPTLALTYALQGLGTSDQSRFDIQIADGTSITQVFTTTQQTSWTDHWVDLSPWSGKTITVTLSLQQKANEPYLKLFLDNVSVGSWLTPVPRTASPNRIESHWAGTSLTVTGENFLPGASIKIGEYLLTGVQFIDDGALQGTLPADLPPGNYDIFVINPAGQEGAIPTGLLLGSYLYLPLIKH